MIDSHWHLYVPYHEDGTDYRVFLDRLQHRFIADSPCSCCSRSKNTR